MRRKISLDLTQYSADSVLLIDDIEKVIRRNISKFEMCNASLTFDEVNTSADFYFNCDDNNYNQICKEISETMGIIV